MKKVYCSQCKYLKDRSKFMCLEYSQRHQCIHPKNIIERTQSSWLQEETIMEYKVSPQIRNGSNECTLYEEEK